MVKELYTKHLQNKHTKYSNTNPELKDNGRDSFFDW